MRKAIKTRCAIRCNKHHTQQFQPESDKHQACQLKADTCCPCKVNFFACQPDWQAGVKSNVFRVVDEMREIGNEKKYKKDTDVFG